MVFNSLAFLLFFSISFIIYWSLSKKLKFQNLFLLLANGLFYAYWDWRFLGLLLITVLSTYATALSISSNRYKRISLWSVIIINIGILGVFKYYNFFAESFANLIGCFGWKAEAHTLNLILPLGISFYTFQSLSYVFDVYKRKIPSTRNIIDLSIYITFFPVICSGPIERADNMLPQISNSRYFRYDTAVEGLRCFIWGWFKKVVIADNLVFAVNECFKNCETANAPTLLWGAIMYTILIYCDFSGYSNMAIGVAKLLGFNVRKNFAFPYFSRNVSEFWRRWHISLTSWFMEYIYFPLGGSRCNKWKQLRNTLVVFTVSGLWHGANWTFIAWGFYHGLLFIPLIFFEHQKYKNVVAEKNFIPNVREIGSMTLVFICAMVGWVMFRADTISQAYVYLYRMFTGWTLSMPAYGKSNIVWILLLLCIEWISRKHEDVYKLPVKNTILRYAIYISMIYLIITAAGHQSGFVYFQF